LQCASDRTIDDTSESVLRVWWGNSYKFCIKHCLRDRVYEHGDNANIARDSIIIIISSSSSTVLPPEALSWVGCPQDG